MAKHLKLKIKNTQLAKAAGLTKVKAKLTEEKEKKKKTPKPKEAEAEQPKQRRIRAKSKSAFAPKEEEAKEKSLLPEIEKEKPTPPLHEEKKKITPEEEKLGPTGKHIKDILERKKKPPPQKKKEEKEPAKVEKKEEAAPPKKELKKGKKVKEFKDLKPLRRQHPRTFDARDRKGLTEGEEEQWRKKRAIKQPRQASTEESLIRPTQLKIKLPIMIKTLAVEMKLKASEIIQKLFLQGMSYTLNDALDDATMVQFIGSEFDCEITIDTTEEELIQITPQTIREEINATDKDQLVIRSPVVTFMGHVDHGKTSLIDAIRESNLTAAEAGAITQHIGAFCCETTVGALTVLDTPGHEAFSAMRARGAEVTDIVVLVVAGDEGMRTQTFEAIQHAKAAGVTIVVAINKSDKPGFNVENIYRELSEIDLLPEAWGGQTITVNTSAVTKEGIPELLEMLALQAEVLELKANPNTRARGTVLESELRKGLGNTTTVLIQNGTLRVGDALVFEKHWGRVKTMHDEYSKLLEEANPSTPVEISGLSGLPSAGDPFIVVKDEKEAREIVEARAAGRERVALQKRKVPSLEALLQKGAGKKKILKLMLRTDVQGSIEALKVSIEKIESEKVEADIIFSGVGDISESDIQLAAASNAFIIGFHTSIESHAEPLIKELGVTVRLFDVIYDVIAEVRAIMLGLLDKIEQEKETGEAEVKTIFKASQLGVIAGCLVTEGTISRNHRIRVVREGEVIWKGTIASVKRVKEDVKEVKKGLECGILLDGFNALEVGDILQAYEIIYLSQEL